jgi:hypothetical protein
MLLLRKILFYIFAAVYVVICPLVIAYALGYIFVPQQRNVIQTGLISLQTIPAGATVFLDSERYARLTPAVISEVPPGPHEVRVTLDGYHDWRCEVVVHPGEAAVIDHVVLVAHRFPKEILKQVAYARAREVPGCGALILTREGAGRGHELFRMDRRRIGPMVAGGIPVSRDKTSVAIRLPGYFDLPPKSQPSFDGLSGLVISRDRRRVLIWSRRRIGIITVRNTMSSLPSAVEFNWIFERGQDIRQCFWGGGGGHLVFRDGNRVNFIHADSADDRQVYQVTDVRPYSDILYDEDSGRVYYLSLETGYMCAVHILPIAGEPLQHLLNGMTGSLE